MSTVMLQDNMIIIFVKNANSELLDFEVKLICQQALETWNMIQAECLKQRCEGNTGQFNCSDC